MKQLTRTELADQLEEVDGTALVQFGLRVAALGAAVQEQLVDLVTGNTEDVNPAAVDEIKRRLYDLNCDLNMAIDDYYEQLGRGTR